jgi:putative transposase
MMLLIDASDNECRTQSPQREILLGRELEYIHNNPVKAGLCELPEEYKYSSAEFYLLNEKRWSFLSHYNG